MTHADSNVRIVERVGGCKGGVGVEGVGVEGLSGWVQEGCGGGGSRRGDASFCMWETSVTVRCLQLRAS